MIHTRMIYRGKKNPRRVVALALGVLAVGLATLAACSAPDTEPAHTESPSIPPSSAAGAGRSVSAPPAPQTAGALSFWRVSTDDASGATMHVLGWVPVNAATVLRFDPVIERAFARAARLVLPDDAALEKQNALIGWKAHLAEGDALARWIPPELHAAYTRALLSGGYPAGTAEVTAPWFAARMVETADWRRTGFVGQSAFQSEFDKYFIHVSQQGLLRDLADPIAGEREQVIVPLEPAAAGYDRFAALSRDAQTALLRVAIARSERAEKLLPASQAAWQRGDTRLLTELFTELSAELSAEVFAELSAEERSEEREGVLDAREAYSATTIAGAARLAGAVAQLLDEAPSAGDAFLVAPMRDLIGPDGTLARLESLGFRVEQLTSLTGGGTLRTLSADETPAPRESASLPSFEPSFEPPFERPFERPFEPPFERGADASRRVLVVGIDGATLRILEPMIAAGRLPALARLAQEGASGPLRSHQPLYSPRIWNSIATGKTPAKHGIEGFTYKDAEGKQQLYLSLDRRAHALWNIASDAGLTVGVVNWWNSYPPEIVRGVMISDHAKPTRLAELRTLTGAATEATTAATVHPAAWSARVALAFAARAKFARTEDPFLGHVGIPPSMQREELSKRYYDDAAVARLALDIERDETPDLLMVFLPGIDRVSHRLWAAVEPPERYPETAALSPLERDAARTALEQYYVFTDELIGRLLLRYGTSDLVFVLSDHGFEAGEHLGDLTGVHDSELALDGVLFARGRGIAAGTSTQGTSVNDITPTVLAWLGLPQGRDMDGKPAAFLAPAVPQPTAIATHDTGKIERLEHEPSGNESEILEQLRTLGYIE